MEQVLARLAALDPAAVVDAARLLPLWAGASLGVVGLALATIGSHKWVFRSVAGLCGAALGWLLGAPIAALIALDQQLGSLAGAAALGVVGAVWPAAAAFLGFGLVGAFIGAKLAPAHETFLGAMPGFVFCGAIAVFLFRSISAILAALTGALLACLGGTAALLATSLEPTVVAYPWVPLIGAGLIFVAGAAFQLTRPPPEQLEEARKQRAELARKKKEDRDQQKRWEKYIGKDQA